MGERPRKPKSNKRALPAHRRTDRNRYRALIETTSDFLWEVDARGRYTFCSPQIEEIWGITPAQALGRTPFDVFSFERRRAYKTKFTRLLKAPRPFNFFQAAAKAGDGRPIWIETSGVPFTDRSGRLLGFRGISRDITERKRAEESERRQTRMLEGINRVLAAALTSTSEEELGVVCLEVAEKLTRSRFGFIAEVGEKGLNAIAVSNPGWNACARLDPHGRRKPHGSFPIHGLYGKVLTSNRPLLTNDPARHPDARGAPPGHPPLEAFLGIPLVRGGHPIGVIAVANRPGGYGPQDQEALETLAPAVVEAFRRKRLEALREALAEQANLRLGAAVEQASDCVIMVDLDGTIRYVNAAFESLNRTPRSQAVGRSYFDFLAGQSPDASRLREALVQGRRWHGPVAGTIAGVGPIELEVTISPTLDPAGQAAGGLITEKDVTQENALQRRLRQAQKMEALGTMAGGISHDFNNLLAAIIMSAEIALLDLDPADPAGGCLHTVLQAANRGKELVKQIISFSRQKEWEKRALEIAPVLDEAVAFLRSAIPKNVTVRETIRPGTEAVLADASQLNQLVVNLAQNAAQAMEERGGVINIVLEPIELDAAEATRFPDLEAGPYVRLTVSDTGAGIPRDLIERIFEPFFTTRKPSGGSGLGLAVVHGIVKSYGGAITVDSKVGRGSTFSVLLPRWRGLVETTRAAEPAQAAIGRGERILLVEDEVPQRNSLARGLRRIGYKVVSQPRGPFALQSFRMSPSAYDVVITDQRMPGMSGLDLAAELVKVRPDIPIILCTGYSEKIDGATIGRHGVRALIMKPFTLEEISRLVRKTLGPRAPSAG